MIVPRQKLEVGERFGRLVVTEVTSQHDSRGNLIYICKCDCGGTRVGIRPPLTGGYTKSCGCLQREQSAANAKNRRPTSEWASVGRPRKIKVSS